MYCRVAWVVLGVALFNFSSVQAAPSTKTDKQTAKKTSAQTAEGEKALSVSGSAKTDQDDTEGKAEKGGKKLVSPWAGSNAQLGLIINTGNTDNTNLSGGVKLLYTKAPWTNLTQLDMQFSRSQGSTTKQRFFGMDQANYSFSRSRKSFIFGNANYTQDKFSPYDYQGIIAVGYGRDLIKSDRFTLNVQAGPGIRFDDVHGPGGYEQNVILSTASSINWNITKNCTLTEQLGYDMGKPYNYLKSVTAVTNKLTGNLAMQISYTMEYYSVIPFGSANTKKLDTTTNIALVYNFA